MDAVSTAVVSVVDRTTRLLDARPQPEEVVTPEDATDGPKLGRLLMRLLRELSDLRRRFAPKRITYRDIVSDGTDSVPYRVTLVHNFGGPVEWWAVDTHSTGTVVIPHVVRDADDSTTNEIALDIYFEGTLAIRVEESA